MIDRFFRNKRRKKKKGGAHGVVMLQIRVRHIKKKDAPPTPKSGVRDALQHLLDHGEMPQGWQFMYVDWKHPDKDGSDWGSGWPERKTSDDVEEFRQAFTRVVQDQIRMADVRRNL